MPNTRTFTPFTENRAVAQSISASIRNTVTLSPRHFIKLSLLLSSPRAAGFLICVVSLIVVANGEHFPFLWDMPWSSCKNSKWLFYAAIQAAAVWLCHEFSLSGCRGSWEAG